MGISFYCFLWRLISVRRVRASNGRQNRFLYRSHRNGQSRKNIVFMRLCGVSGIHFLRRGEQIILLFFMTYNYNRLWKLLIDKGVRKTQMRLQAGISTNILTKTGKGEPVAKESLVKIATALNCGLNDIVEITQECEVTK